LHRIHFFTLSRVGVEITGLDKILIPTDFIGWNSFLPISTDFSAKKRPLAVPPTLESRACAPHVKTA
jgi:hypothetical protein